MVDRIFAFALLAVTLGYGFIAFTAISAPFQYDPLGPESWPRILASVMVICLAVLIWRPDIDGLEIAKPAWLQLAGVLVLLLAYAELYEPFGFVIATFGFCAVFARLLGTTTLRAVIFGAVAGIGGYLLCAGLLDLNLPAGPLPRI
ncbi:tripartite tricarboxylate transporter TctB family protein [Ruegeria profundi]|uniref:tripartite tricarboxylate transporter TctB family protein n=1 Tax=Ruegeria profundi TaxID=1685378 RepID=UPI001CD3589F|nr:tripartite tricarboxylate transporter TctB family protein [Ruegeria profundi]MCA0930676.1 tripartite tricarboxylate transporter TctB family protein [Ruegeria profundi]